MAIWFRIVSRSRCSPSGSASPSWSARSGRPCCPGSPVYSATSPCKSKQVVECCALHPLPCCPYSTSTSCLRPCIFPMIVPFFEFLIQPRMSFCTLRSRAYLGKPQPKRQSVPRGQHNLYYCVCVLWLRRNDAHRVNLGGSFKFKHSREIRQPNAVIASYADGVVENCQHVCHIVVQS